MGFRESEGKSKNKCFIFTLYYPFTHQGVAYDNYIQTEINELSMRFDEVHVVSMSQGHDGHSDVAGNVEFVNYTAQPTSLEKILAVKFLFTGLFWAEINKVRNIHNLKLSWGLIKEILLFLVKADKYQALLEGKLDKTDWQSTNVVIYSYWTFANSLAAVQVKQKYPLKVFTRMHSLDLYFDRSPQNYLPFRDMIFNGSERTFFISEQGRTYFFNKHNVANKNKGVINRLGIVNSSTPQAFSKSKLVLLSNAWIQPLKRINLIVEALATISEFEIEWLHIGDDYGTNRFGELKQLAQNLLGSKGNIQYEFVGRKTTSEIYAIFAEKRPGLFINVSSTEGIPVSIMEALSFGVPVIATRVGGVPEIVENGYNGFLLKGEIVASDVAGAIKNYMALSNAEKERLSANARKVWEEKYNAQNNSRALIDELFA